MKLALGIVTFLWFSLSFGQSSVEEIENGLSNQKVDTSLINDYLFLVDHYLSEDSVQALRYLDKVLSLSTELEYKEGQAHYFHYKGRYHYTWGYDLDRAEQAFQEAFFQYRDLGMSEDELMIVRRLSGLYRQNGDDKKAFEIFNKALESHPDDLEFQMVINSNIGTLLKGIDEGEKAIEYMDKSEEFYLQIENPRFEIVQMQISNDKNRGVIYRNEEQFDTAEFYLSRALETSVDVQDTAWMARNYNSIGIMYARQDLIVQALEAYQKSLDLKRAMEYTDGIVTTCANIGALYIQVGDYRNAEKYLREAESLIAPGLQRGREALVTAHLAELSYAKGKYKDAYDYLYRTNYIEDSLETDRQRKVAQELEAQYQNENNKIAQEKLQAELAAADLRERSKTEQLQRQKVYMILGISIGIILLTLIVFVIRSNIKRKQINNELQSKNDEILEMNQEITIQKQQIEEKNAEIIDSITYAKRIQEAILPSDELIRSELPQSFVYYAPKDILAGDFYWLEMVDDLVVWAAADCTGHGIPGAMVSVVCHNALNRSVHEFGLRSAGEILDKTRELVIENFEKSQHQVKDGMDIALCILNKQSNRLQFAGANNPLWLVRRKTEFENIDGLYELEGSDLALKEIKGDKQPIGQHYVHEEFNNHEIDLRSDDRIYVFSDGFADQFGGDKGKKLKAKNLKSLILKYASEPISDQGTKLQKEFESWKGDFEQLDDVCVIGVRI